MNTLSPAEKRKLERRESNIQQILSAGRELLKAKSLNEISMEEIAKVAGFGKGTLYNHFANKDQLVWHLLGEAQQEFQSDGNKILVQELPFKEKLSAILKLISENQTQHHYLKELIDYGKKHFRDNWQKGDEMKIAKTIAHKHFDWFRNFFQEAIDKKEIPHTDAPRLATLLVTLITEFDYFQEVGFSPKGDNTPFIIQLVMLERGTN